MSMIRCFSVLILLCQQVTYSVCKKFKRCFYEVKSKNKLDNQIFDKLKETMGGSCVLYLMQCQISKLLTHGVYFANYIAIHGKYH